MWVGTADGFDPATGNVSADGAYVSSWYQTMDFPRGNVPGSVTRATSDYCCGASQIFPRDCYGSDAQATECWPSTPAASAQVLNDAAALLQDSFSWASAAAGVETYLGIEVPLTKPPGSNATLQALYEGIFARMAAATPAVSGLWLWTTEGVEDHGTGKGYPQSNPLWDQLVAEIGIVLAARDKAAPGISVGMNGWCLGPGDNSSFFDKVVADPRFSLSSISGCLGWCDVDEGFANVTVHGANVIPWLEDDLGLAGAELWVARTLRQAADAERFGASGLLALLWRTWETEPQMAALAAAGWSGAANASTLSVYEGFCAANFGAATADVCAALFVALDGATEDGSFQPPLARLPRGGQGCCGGPFYPAGAGGEGEPAFINTTALHAWAASVSGAANAERAARWVGLIEYHSSLAEASLAGAALQTAAAQVHDEQSAREIGFPALAQMSWAWAAMETALLEFVTTPGELGMLAAHEGANWPSNFFAGAGSILPYMASCAAFDAPDAGCFSDNYTKTGRVLPYTVTISNGANSREWCALQCLAAGYAIAGVEFGVACFCGDAPPPARDALPLAACGAMACAGAPREGCGDADIISVYSASCAPVPDLPPGLLPPRGYGGARRLWLTAARTAAFAAEGSLRVEAAVLATEAPTSVTATFWSTGGPNTSVPLSPVRSLWVVALPLPSDTTLTLEYVVQAKWASGDVVVTPIEGAASVVIL